jgi:hypothetical protein
MLYHCWQIKFRLTSFVWAEVELLIVCLEKFLDHCRRRRHNSVYRTKTKVDERPILFPPVRKCFMQIRTALTQLQQIPHYRPRSWPWRQPQASRFLEQDIRRQQVHKKTSQECSSTNQQHSW